MSTVLRMEGSGKVVDLYPWLSAKARGVEALAGILGFGLPGVNNQWFDGAGGGSTWRGSRVRRREVKLPLVVYADDRAQLNQEISDLAILLDPFVPSPESDRGAARLFFGMPDDSEWYTDVVRDSGGDWARKVDSNDRTRFKTVLNLEAPDPFWTRVEPEMFETVQQGGEGGRPTLLPKFARLRVSSAGVFGTQLVNNFGDTYAWPIFTIEGPATGVILIGPNGEELIWDGELESGETLVVDMRANTVTDGTGANRYDGLAPAPRFWSLAPGSSEITMQANEISNDSRIHAQWWPRRWAVV